MAAAARHVAWQNGGLARNMVAHVARDEPCIEIIAAAGRITDIEIDRLALVELRHCILRKSCRGEREQGERNCSELLGDDVCGTVYCAGSGLAIQSGSAPDAVTDDMDGPLPDCGAEF